MNSSTTPLRPLKMHTCILRVPVFLLSHLIFRPFSSQNFIVPPNFIGPLCLIFLLSQHYFSSGLLLPLHINHSLFSLSIPLFLTTMFFALYSSHYSSPTTLFSLSLFISELSSLLYLLCFVLLCNFRRHLVLVIQFSSALHCKSVNTNSRSV